MTSCGTVVCAGLSKPLSLLLAGAILLDLEQTTLPGIAHLVVETMIISDQIKAEDRANVLRALLLKHRWAQAAGEGEWGQWQAYRWGWGHMGQEREAGREAGWSLGSHWEWISWGQVPCLYLE